jgi:hypothetical protein
MTLKRLSAAEKRLKRVSKMATHMSKRLQVLLGEPELREIQRAARDIEQMLSEIESGNLGKRGS